MGKEFFEEMTEASEVKSKIVSDYFSAWVRIMNARANSDRLAYIDLYSGPGRYEDGSKSTPLKIMEKIASDDALSKKMVTLFNDADPEFASNLENELTKIEGYDKLKYKPQVYNNQIGEDIATLFEKTNMVPTFAFIDPWGYKGLTSSLISALIKDWGSDCIFYFNYNRINMGLANDSVKEHLDSLFGEERADKLRKEIKYLSPEERELTILNELAESLKAGNANYVLPFRFMKNGKRTSHYLILVSKHVLGYSIMKDIMYRESSEYTDEVASFSYIPTQHLQLSLLSLYDRKLDTLGDELLTIFAGKTLTVMDIYNAHHVDTPFVKKNYKTALLRLEEHGKITCATASGKKRKKGTMADHINIIFPA